MLKPPGLTPPVIATAAGPRTSDSCIDKLFLASLLPLKKRLIDSHNLLSVAIRPERSVNVGSIPSSFPTIYWLRILPAASLMNCSSVVYISLYSLSTF